MNGKGMDTIQFIQDKENLSKHEALLKAQQLLTGQLIQPHPPTVQATAELYIKSSQALSTAVFTEFFVYCKKALPLTKKATSYLDSRGLDYKHCCSTRLVVFVLSVGWY